MIFAQTAFRLKHAGACLFLVAATSSWGAPLRLPASFPGQWDVYGRTSLQQSQNSVALKGGFLSTLQAWEDCELSFRARAPLGAEQVQIWAGLRARGRDTRYVLALRGGENNDLYFARYAPDGGIKFLGLVPLEFKPEVGKWYSLRVLARGKDFQIYLNGEKQPRLCTEDAEGGLKWGGIVLGGGWIETEFSDVHVKPFEASASAAFDIAQKNQFHLAQPDREARRTQERAAYKPMVVTDFNGPRSEISLNGKWLFKPDQDLDSAQKPVGAGFDDQSWHLLGVPGFWTPSLAWQYGETAFPKLKNVSELAVGKGESDNILREELARLDNCTFDWRKTKGGWYRHHVVIPAIVPGKRYELCFDGIAKVSEIWVNQTKVGTHIGMFGEIRCDITSALQPGENVVAVHALANWDKTRDDNSVKGVAVTVEITAKMLTSLPHGMYDDRVAGIWQPVKLVATSPALVNEVVIRPSLEGAKVQANLLNTDSNSKAVEIGYTISSKMDGAILCQNDHAVSGTIPGSNSLDLKFETPKLAPKLWSPSEPNLYNLEVRLSSDGQLIDRQVTSFGFRTFAVEGNRLMLNGKPYWLRGGNHFPTFLRPNDGQYARQFMQMARDGNLRATRSHVVSMTTPWLDAADEVGMGISYEGTWPWLMLKGDLPDPDLLKIWKEEFASLIRRYRNHPSLLMWTVNNEMKFPTFDRNNPELLKKKWTVITDMIKTMREIDPTRPIVMDSGYLRKEGDYEKIVKPNGFDDGDIDDAHRYYGWYNPTFFHYFNGEFGQGSSWPNRPLISQEMSTGYPRNDDGHPSRGYLFAHYTPQALVGDYAYENVDPAFFLKRQAFMTKELAETLRRADRDKAAGILHFAYLTWLRTIEDPARTKPFEAYYGLKTALQPVLVSAELFGRHCYAGSTMTRRVCVANDSEDASALPPSRLLWAVMAGGKTLSSGAVDVPGIAYYENRWVDVDFKMPQTLPAPRVDALLTLRLQVGGKEISANQYDLTVASREWAGGGLPARLSGVALFDPHGKAANILGDIGTVKSASIAEARAKGARVIIVGDVKALSADSGNLKAFHEFIRAGGRGLLLNAGANLKALYPEQIKGYKATKGEIVNLHVPESPVFDGIEPLDLAWFEPGTPSVPLACTGRHQIDSSRLDVLALAEQMDIHGYLKMPQDVVEISGAPLVEIREGNGRVINSEMALETGINDPIARRLLTNTIKALGM